MAIRVPEEKEFAEWLHDPVTEAVLEYCARKRAGMRDNWEHGELTDWERFSHAIINAANVGMCRAYADIQQLEYEQLKGELEDEPERTETVRQSSAGRAVHSREEKESDRVARPGEGELSDD